MTVVRAPASLRLSADAPQPRDRPERNQDAMSVAGLLFGTGSAPSRTIAPVPEPRRQVDPAERRLAARLAARDPEALAVLYRGYGAATFGLLLRLLGDRATAEDVQQSVFVEVWKRGAEYDPERAGLLTWLLTIARSRGIDQLRKRLPEPRDPHDADVRSVESEADALLDRWRVAHLLARLPDDERSLLRMRFYEDLSQSEISAATGIAMGTIKARMVRGLARLREMIDAEEA
jgi:RNA polymerase sigma-70 factor, ECF subfamily